MRRALLSSIVLLGVTALFSSSSAWAVERELGGVALGTRAVVLLTRPGFGQPDFIGPLGTVGAQQAAPARTGGAVGAAARAGRQGAAARAGMARQGGMMGGQGMMGGAGMGRQGRRGGGGPMGALPGGGTRLAQSPSLHVDLTQAATRRGGMMGQGMMGQGMGAGRMGGAAGTGRAAAGRAAAGRAAGAARGTTVVRAQAQPNLYWLYQRPGGAVLVLTLDTRGTVVAITVNGSLPFASARTSKGINLGNDYMDVIRQYGYPDQAVTSGGSLDLTYLDHGVRFRLDGMRVDQITIGAYVEAARAGVPVPVAVPQGPTGPGLSVDELKGYM